MLHSIISLYDIFNNKNLPDLNGFYISNNETEATSQQIMSTNPKDFLSEVNLGE